MEESAAVEASVATAVVTAVMIAVVVIVIFCNEYVILLKWIYYFIVMFILFYCVEN